MKDQTTQRLRVFKHLPRALLAVNLSQPLLTSPNLFAKSKAISDLPKNPAHIDWTGVTIAGGS